MRATQLLYKLGQSIWLDNITRDLLDTGKLSRYIEEYSVTGLTSNPTIFERAIRNSPSYDAPFAKARRQSQRGHLFRMALDDLTRAADLFRPIHERTNTVDGWVSLKSRRCLPMKPTKRSAPPANYSHAPRAPTSSSRFPEPKEGLPAIEEAIFAGVPVNVTLLFSREQYSPPPRHSSAESTPARCGTQPQRRIRSLGVRQPLGRRGRG